MSLVAWPCICERSKSQLPKRLVQVTSWMMCRRPYKIAQRSARRDLTVSIDDLDLQMRMNAADRANASLGRLIA